MVYTLQLTAETSFTCNVVFNSNGRQNENNTVGGWKREAKMVVDAACEARRQRRPGQGLASDGV